MKSDSSKSHVEMLRRKAERILKRSPGMESMSASNLESLGSRGIAEGGGLPTDASRAVFEAIIRWYRPVLAVTDDRFIQPARQVSAGDPNPAASKQLLEALESNRATLDAALRSVGRIELKNNVNFPWVGTGWIVDTQLGNDIIVTNAHVAREFGKAAGNRFVFRPGIPNYNALQAASIDFREELNGAASREFAIDEIIWISEMPAFDMALLRVARTAGTDRIDRPLQLLTAEPDTEQMLAVVGYPGSNNGYDPEPFRNLFGSVLGAKRFSPGFYAGRRGESITYDCSTLPGSSGSIVLDVKSGKAVGLHFAGTAFDTNYAVPAAELERVIRKRPWQTESVTVRLDPLPDRPALVLPQSASVTGAPAYHAGDDIKLSIPIEITVRLGAARASAGDGGNAVAAATAPARKDATSAQEAATRVRQHLQGEKGVLAVRAGYLFRSDELSDDMGVIVGVAPGSSLDPSMYGLGSSVDGVEISVEHADPETIAAEQLGLTREAFGGRRAQYERDLSDPRFDLSPVEDDMKITLHVSPEAGWPVLKAFLARTDGDRLTIGMYHMTAPHVVKAIEAIARREKTHLTLSLDRQRGDASPPDDTGGDTKAQDIAEKDTLAELARLAGEHFKWAPASLGASGLFASAYHIKMAVWSRGAARSRQHLAFWLSSGNWQSSNQEPLERDPNATGDLTWNKVKKYNREWHAIVEHPGLARIACNHLEQDYEDNRDAAVDEAVVAAVPDVLVSGPTLEVPRTPRQFKAFRPREISGRVKVQLLLTPDNYPEVDRRSHFPGARARAGAEPVFLVLERHRFDPGAFPDDRARVARTTTGRARCQSDLPQRVRRREGGPASHEAVQAQVRSGECALLRHLPYERHRHRSRHCSARLAELDRWRNRTEPGRQPRDLAPGCKRLFRGAVRVRLGADRRQEGALAWRLRRIGSHPAAGRGSPGGKRV